MLALHEICVFQAGPPVLYGNLLPGELKRASLDRLFVAVDDRNRQDGVRAGSGWKGDLGSPPQFRKFLRMRHECKGYRLVVRSLHGLCEAGLDGLDFVFKLFDRARQEKPRTEIALAFGRSAEHVRHGPVQRLRDACLRPDLYAVRYLDVAGYPRLGPYEAAAPDFG